MKIANGILVNLLNTLGSYSEYKLPQKIGYAITRNMMAIQKEYSVYEKQMKKILEDFKEYTLKDDDGNLLFEENGLPKIEQDHLSDFIKEMNELLNIEIDINLYKVDISVFDYEDTDKYDSLSAIDIIKLQDILCNQPDEDIDNEETK